MSTDTATIGKKGEAIALAFLRAQHYKIYECNARLRRDEIDIVAYDPYDRVMVFAEVKTRSSDHPDFSPEMNLTPRKKEAMLRAARTWIAEHDFEGGYRIDVILIANERITHLQQVELD